MRYQLLIVGMFLLGCADPSVSSGASTAKTSPEKTPSAVTATENQAGLPDDIRDYRKWLKINASPIPPSVNAPHTPSQGNKNIFVNQERAVLAPTGQQKYPFPAGTLVVKEALHKEQGFVEVVALMRKIKDLDAVHGDWQFHEYTRNGPQDTFRLAYKDSTCWRCHAGAKDKDYTFVPLSQP